MSNMTENDLFDYNGLKVYQNNSEFKFSLDSILLAEFVDIKLTTKKIVDFCTGIGTIPLILSTKTNAQIYGIEIQKDTYELGLQSIKRNNKNNIFLINDDVLNANKHFNNFDIVVCNPPYFKVNSSAFLNKNENKAIARHELKLTLEDIIKQAVSILKDHGHLFLCHRPERLIEIINLLEENSFSIKKLQLVYSKFEKNAIIVLIDACKRGKEGLIVKSPIEISNLKSYQNIFKE